MEVKIAQQVRYAPMRALQDIKNRNGQLFREHPASLLGVFSAIQITSYS